MGPRLEGRGNIVPMEGRQLVPLLQWGRVLKDAEIGDLCLRGHGVRIASMGPRLEGRGNGLGRPIAYCRWRCFNGAAS